MADHPGSTAPRMHGMAWRVGLVAVLSAALGGLAASAVAIVAVDRLVSEQANQRLRAATVTLAGELDEDLRDKKPDGIDEVVQDENGEIVTSGIRLAVFEQGRLLSGDDWIRAPVAGTCETWPARGGRVRACAGAHESWILVAAQPIDDGWLHWVYVLAAVGAVLLGASTGAIGSARLSRWATQPLRQISRGLRASRPDAPAELALGPKGRCEEVEEIRTALLDLATRLQALLDHAQRFAGDAAHELRTPLTALRAELELLGEELDGAPRAAIERAAGRVTALSELVNRLLVLALPADNLTSDFEAVALSDVVADTLAELPAQERSRVRTEIRGEGLVRGDPRLLSSLVSNATQNALKFAAEGEIVVRATERSAVTGAPPEVVLEVQDDGPGVPMALRERVFEPFFRAKPGATAGHGLGLALIGHIARAHGGAARFLDSTRGARLEVTIPGWSARAATSLPRDETERSLSLGAPQR